jgi:oxazoline/thiazoline dehydrogenase
MQNPLLLSLHPDCIYLKKKPEARIVELHSRRLSVQKVNASVLQALDVLAIRKVSEDELCKILVQKNREKQLYNFYYILQQLTNIGAICYTIQGPLEELVTLIPLSPLRVKGHKTVPSTKRFMLSRFAYLRCRDKTFLLHSPLTNWIAVLQSSDIFRLLIKLRVPYSLQELKKEFRYLGNRRLEVLWNFLILTKFLQTNRRESPSLLQWEFHDLVFHSQSRMGKRDNRYGATYRFKNKTKAPPAVKSIAWKKRYRLYKPDINKIKKSDARLTDVLEKRKSIRSSDENNPISLVQLGEFLYRTARVKKVSHLQRPYQFEYATRPYPGAGGCYELEIYPVIRTCRGVPAGLYYYEAKNHQLCKVSELTPSANLLLYDALKATGEVTPQVLLCISARFPRVFWKYEGMAYAAILKDVGVLYQTMYLVATAMGLSCCALGGGNSDLFAESAAVDYYSETTVGEFMIGSKLKS